MHTRWLTIALLLFTLPLAAQENGEEDKPEWDVMNPPGDTETVTVDVTEGTWMSVDVSPDGEQIVFDLLGDVFVIPFAGGEAKALTEGLAWDGQPVYSPDGQWIAFTSDRGGAENIWIMDRDGENLQQVTEEDFRTLNSPTWTPDSNFIAARKHYTGPRSLGQGQVWLYHRSGGEGVKIAAFKSEDSQKELGAPAFSPDGRYLYYALDATPGDRFQYNKDPNEQIFIIRRLDRESGDQVDFVTGPGGAIRPTPSPDGELLAFIRRVRGESVLFLKDLESGKEWPIYRDLDRDLQEVWAVHGVYPQLSFTPDANQIVFWAGGKINKINVESGASSVIPFHVSQEYEYLDALRFPVEMAPEAFDVKMLRWTQVSPEGDQVVFQALGHLYARTLPDGEPRRLTTQNERFELYPRWSRDGEHIVYVTWDDQDFGSVRVVPAAGGESRVVSPEPGHYAEPVISPDGKWIVYHKLEGNALLGENWGLAPGIYKVPFGGGEAVKLTDYGQNPQFGARSDRVYLMVVDEYDKRRLVSVNLDGFDERTLLKSDYAVEFAVSPDGHWVAFQERYQAYVTPFVDTGGAYKVGPEMKAFPVKQVSADAGDWLHWAGDSRTLHWAHGPELFGLELNNAFTFLDGGPEEPVEPPEEGINLGFSQPFAVPEGTIAFTGGRIVTMNEDLQVIENGVVVVRDNRIAAVGAAEDVNVPEGARVVDIAGKTLLPGLVDVHWHGRQGANEIIPEQNWVNYATLALGVTTIHDPSNDTSEIFAASELARAGAVTGPRIFSTGTILYGADTAFTAEIKSLEDAEHHLRRLKQAGAFSVKSYNQPRRDARQMVVAAARDLEMMVVPEGGSVYQHNMTQVMDGHTGVEHSLPLGAVYDDVLQLWRATEVGYTPTLVVAYGAPWGENYWYAKTKVWQHPILSHYVPRTILDPRSRRRMTAPDEAWGHVQNAQVAAALQDAGVSVQLGAHGQREGLGAHWELWMFVQGGMSEMEALRAATIDGARYLGMGEHIGSIEEGKLADLFVVDGNPLEDIRVSDDVYRVMVNGQLYGSEKMDRIAPEAEARAPFWFEDCPYHAGPGLPCGQ